MWSFYILRLIKHATTFQQKNVGILKSSALALFPKFCGCHFEKADILLSVYFWIAIKYQVQVFTGSEPNSNTEANIYVHMFGKNSDSGPRKLLKCKNNKKKFQVGQMDLFEIEAVNLGKLQKVVVGHDGKEKGQGWYLEKIIIKESKNSKSEFLFPSKR